MNQRYLKTIYDQCKHGGKKKAGERAGDHSMRQKGIEVRGESIVSYEKEKAGSRKQATRTQKEMGL